MRVRLLALLFVLLIAPNAFGQGGVVTGVVGARATGQLVSGATVTVQGTTNRATTNALGRFRIEGVSPGRVTLNIEAPGFLTLQFPEVQVQAGTPQEVVIDLEVTPNILEQVQVTATKEPTAAGAIAAQTDVVSRETIDQRGEQSLVQALNHIPGAVISTQLGIFESFSLRGVERGDPEFTKITVLIDGVPQTLANNAARVVALPIDDAGSIEVFRGPNSATYGRSAVAGVINVRTKDPAPTHNVSLDFVGGQFEAANTLVSVTGPIGSWGGYYASAGNDHNHGFWKSKTGESKLGNSSFFGKFTFAPDSKSFGSVTVNRVVSNNGTPTNEPIINGQFLHNLEPSYDRLTSFNIPGKNYQQGETRTAFNYMRRLTSWLSASETFGYRDVQHKFDKDGDFIGSPYDTVNHLVTMYPFSQQLDETVYFQEARLEFTPRMGSVRSNATFGHTYEWNGGGIDADFIYTDEDLFGFPINYLNPVIPPEDTWQHDPAAHRSYHQGIHGLFGQYTIEPVSRLVLTAGGRYDRLKLDHTRGSNAKVQKTLEAFSPKASVTVRLVTAERAALSVYGSYAQSFIPPRRPSALSPSDPPLDPEEIENYESGLKGSFLGGRLTAEASYFQTKEDGVVLSTRVGPVFFPTNAGSIRYKGFETGMNARVTRKISTYFNASFYRNRYGRFIVQTSGGDNVITGNRLPIAPDRVLNWGASFDPAKAWNLNVNFKHVGPVQSDQDNTFALPQFTVVDAAASWKHGKVRLTLSAHNIFDKEYYWTGGETADWGTPRQVLAGIHLDLN